MARQIFQDADDKILWNRFREGNSDAFEIIYQRCISKLANYGRRLCWDDELVKDAIHDLFLDLWKNRQNLGPTDSIEFYVIKAYRRNLIKKLETTRRWANVKVEGPNFELSFEEKLIKSEHRQEQLEQLKEKLNTLSERHKEAVFLKFYWGLSYSKIAVIMGVNAQSANNMVFRAMKKLRKKMSYYLPSAIAFLAGTQLF